MNRIRAEILITDVKIISAPLEDHLIRLLDEELYRRLKRELEVKTKKEVADLLRDQLLNRLREELSHHFRDAGRGDAYETMKAAGPPWLWKRAAEVLLLDGNMNLADPVQIQQCACACWLEEVDPVCVFCQAEHPRRPRSTTAYRCEPITLRSLEQLAAGSTDEESAPSDDSDEINDWEQGNDEI